MQWATKNIITSTWDEINLTSASATTITQPQTSARSCLICSHHTWTRIRSDLFFLPDLQLLPPLCKTLFSATKSFGRQVWCIYRTQPKKKVLLFFVSLSGVCEGWGSGCWWWSRGEESRVCTKVFSFLYNSLPPTAHSYSHTHTLSNLKAGQQRKLKPCGHVTHSVSLLLRRTVLKFPDPKSGKFYRQIAKLPAAVVLIVESNPKVVSNSNKYL